MATLLVSVGASTWIITNPINIGAVYEKSGKTLISVKPIEIDYNGYTGKGLIDAANEASNSLVFNDESGNEITLVKGTDYTVSNITNITDDTVSNITDDTNLYNTTTNASSIAVGSTYLANSVKNVITLTDSGAELYEFGGNLAKSATESGVLIKYKTAKIGSSYYTIEDALNIANDGFVSIEKGETSFTSLTIAEYAGYNEECYTVKDNVTLLLPYKEGDTVGTNTTTTVEAPSDDNDSVPDENIVPANANVTSLFVKLTIKNGIALTNEGAIIVGACVGSQETNKVSKISGGYAEIQLNGNIESNGTFTVYGNVEGTGRIDAKSGTVTERFEIISWPGGGGAAGRFMGGQRILGTSLLSDTTITSPNPTKFPFEDYQMVSISGPTLKISYGTKYLGDVRIYTSRQEQLSMVVRARLNVATVNLVTTSEDKVDGTVNGLIGLKADAWAEKTVKDNRIKLRLNGNAEGGIFFVSINVFKATIKMDTANVKLPIAQSLDIILQNGTFDSGYAYEFMSKSTLTVNNNATLTLSNDASEDGVIFYGDSKITVAGTLNINGVFGGNVYGENGGKVNVKNGATLTASGYVGGTGTFARSGFNIEFTYKPEPGYPISVSTTGVNNDQGKTAQWQAGETWQYINGAWISDKTQFNINYKFICDGVELENSNITINNSEYYTISGLSLNDAYFKGYNFIGWYLDQACAHKIEIIDAEEQNYSEITLYGLFEKSSEELFELTYNTNMATGSSSTIVSIRTNELDSYNPKEKNVPIQEYHTFIGWYKDAECTGEEVVSLTPDDFVDGSLTLYAKWQTSSYQLTYSLGDGVSSVVVSVDGNNISSGDFVEYGKQVTVTVSTSSGYKDPKFKYNGIELDSGNSFSMPGDKVEITTSATKSSSGCFAPGTLITLKDGTQKKVEDLVMGVDQILVYDHLLGQLTSTNAFFVLHRDEQYSETIKLYFSDGAMVQVFFGHGFFDMNTNQYEIISADNVAQYVGHKFYSTNYVDNELVENIVELVSYEISYEYSECYSIYAGVYVNHYVNGMLAVSDSLEGMYNIFELDENMKIDQAKMQADIEKYGLFTYEDWSAYCTEEEFYLCNVQYLKVSLGKGLVTMEQIYHYFEDFLSLYH